MGTLIWGRIALTSVAPMSRISDSALRGEAAARSSLPSQSRKAVSSARLGASPASRSPLPQCSSTNCAMTS